MIISDRNVDYHIFLQLCALLSQKSIVIDEIQKIAQFSLNQYLQCGGLPSVYLSANPQEELILPIWLRAFYF